MRMRVYVCVNKCARVCVCVLTNGHFWGPKYENTPEFWGPFKLWGHFQVPTRKISSKCILLQKTAITIVPHMTSQVGVCVCNFCVLTSECNLKLMITWMFKIVAF